MELAIRSIADKGDLANERVGITVLKECDIKFYILFSTNLSPSGFYNRSNATYWFAPQKLKPTDKVVIYTKKGENSIKTNPDGTNTYFFYWGLSAPLFKNEKDIVVLGEISNWELSKGK